MFFATVFHKIHVKNQKIYSHSAKHIIDSLKKLDFLFFWL